MNDDLIKWLQNWYTENCNGDWEHYNGISINNLDNPGWSITIDLEDTKMENINFTSVDIEKDDNDWFACKVEKRKFRGACGPLNLLEVIDIFKSWVESNKNQNE
jgi:Immunity protein 53